MDKKGKQILSSFDYNARQQLSKASKKLKISQQLLKYHLQKFEESDIIRGYRVILEIGKLGYLGYRVFFQLQEATTKMEKDLIEYFKNHPNVLWFVSTQGSWDLEVLVMARNYIHFDNILREFVDTWGTPLKKYVISISVLNYHLSREYLTGEKRDHVLPPFIGSEPDKEQLDEMDKKIITLLSKDARMSHLQMQPILGITRQTIKNKIKRMEQLGVIQGYRTWINTFSLGYKYYKIMITFQSVDATIEKELYQFCIQEQNVIYFIRCIGEWHFEIDGEFKDDTEFRNMLRRLRNKFSTSIKNVESLLIYGEHKMNYFPMGTL